MAAIQLQMEKKERERVEQRIRMGRDPFESSNKESAKAESEEPKKKDPNSF